MVKRSLVFKLGLSVSLVFFACVPISITVGHLLQQQGRQESIRTFITPQLEAIADEVAQYLDGEAPTPEELRDLERAARHRMRFVPWDSPSEYPEALKRQAILVDVRSRREQIVHWVRLERDGRPFGALELSPMRRPAPSERPHPPLDPLAGPPPFGWMGPPPEGVGPPRPPGPPLTPPSGPGLPAFVLLWLALLGVAIVPPLWLWVLRPLQEMGEVARRLGAGDLDTEVPVRRHDEFGDLERAFENMRVELRRAIRHRERLLTDVSHEIRGPLTRMTLALPLLEQEGAPSAITELFARELKAANDMLGDVLARAVKALRPCAVCRWTSRKLLAWCSMSAVSLPSKTASCSSKIWGKLPWMRTNA